MNRLYVSGGAFLWIMFAFIGIAPRVYAQELQLTLSLKKANVVAGEPIVVCADANMPPSHLWARTRTAG